MKQNVDHQVEAINQSQRSEERDNFDLNAASEEDKNTNTDSASAQAETDPAAENVAADEQPQADEEASEFDEMMENYLGQMTQHKTGQVIDATVVDVKREYVLLDIGDKAEGTVGTSEFQDAHGNIQVSVGDKIPVLLMSRDEESGQFVVSHRRARERAAWKNIRDHKDSGEPMQGRVVQAVNKGVLVDIGVRAFMPASQIDTSRVEDLEEWVGREVDVAVLEFDQRNRRAVVSRRQLLEQKRREAEAQIFDELEIGQERVVLVKKIMDFGAFVDLGGVDGLIPRSEVSWDNNAHPSQYLVEGHDLKVKVIDLDPEQKKITLSRRQMRPDPWDKVAEKYPEGSTVKGQVVKTTNFEAIVNVEEGIQGYLHHSNLSWARERQKVSEVLKEGDAVRCVVMGIDNKKRRLSLGLKQLEQDPWEKVEEEFPEGSKIKGEVVSITNFGAFIRLNEYVDGMVHVSDLSWDRNIKNPNQVLKVGEETEAIVLSVDPKQRRINLGIKQLETSPFESFTRMHKKGSAVEGEVVKMLDFGAVVQLAEHVDGVIHVSQISEERVEKPEDVLKVGDKVQAVITKIDHRKQRIDLSRRELIKRETKKEMASYMNNQESGGVNMGELLADIQLAESDPNELDR